MAFGKHWEWRGFGPVSPALRERVEALPLLHPTAQIVTDTYLWLPGCAVNVKLRFDDLKLKRRLNDAGGVEEWLEDPAENFSFPLNLAAQERLAAALAIQPFWKAAPKLAREELLRSLAGSDVKTIAVEKSRRQFSVALSGSHTEAVTVELAEITAPESIVSVGLEHPEREPVEAALRELGLPGSLRTVSYLEALSVWAGGGKL